MRSTAVFMVAGAVLILVLVTSYEVNAYPDPCFLWPHRHRHREETTSTSSTAKPTAESLEDTSNEVKKKSFRTLEKIFGEWLYSEPLQEKPATATPASVHYNKNPMEEFLSNYMKFMSYLFSF